MSLHQQFHWDVKNKLETLRTEWVGKESGVRYNPKIHFGSWEVRQFLEVFDQWGLATVSVRDAAIARATMVAGFPFQGKTWYVAGEGSGAYVRDDATVMVLLPERISREDFFAKLGLTIHLNNRVDGWKVSKYLKRLFSHHARYLQGTVVENVTENIIRVRLDNGKDIHVRYVSEMALTDGMNLCSTNFLKTIDFPQTREGTGIRITALSPHGFSKGHAIALNNQRHDLVLFGSKPLLTGDQFTFACDVLHPGKLFTDIQSVTNFRLNPFLLDWAEQFMIDVIKACDSEDELKRMLGFYKDDFHTDPITGDWVVDQEREWALTRALRNGVDIIHHPKLRHKLFNLFTQPILDQETKIRIPIKEGVGGARYAMVDPTIFDEWGNPTNIGMLEGVQCWVPKHVGPVAAHRQPNAHRSEHIIMNGVQVPYFDSIDTGSFTFISRDFVIPGLKALGGGDQDDRLCYYTDPAVVRHFQRLESYPIYTPVVQLDQRKKLFSDLNPARKLDSFMLTRVGSRPLYNRDLIERLLNMQESNNISIGAAVNPIMIDTAITDNREAIMEYMLSLPPDYNIKLPGAIRYVDTYEANQLAELASRLEDIIDSVKKNGIPDQRNYQLIQEYNRKLLVIPNCMTGRVSASRQNENGPLTIRIPLDDLIDNIKISRMKLEDFIVATSWEMIVPIPVELERANTHESAPAVARLMREDWQNLISTYVRSPEPPDPIYKDKKLAMRKVDEELYNKYRTYPYVLDAMVWLYGTIYRVRKLDVPMLENDRPQPFPDAILWGPCMSGLTIQMLEREGLTKKFVRADLEDKFAYKETDLDINVGDNVITIEGTNQTIGTVNPMAYPDLNIKTKLDKGMVAIPVRAAVPYTPPDTYLTFDVVGGLVARGASPMEVQEWKAKVFQMVNLVPYTFVGTNGEEEQAIQVELQNGIVHGHIAKVDVDKFPTDRIIRGQLAPGKTPRTLTVLVKVTKHQMEEL